MRHPFCLQTLGNSWSRIRLYALLIGVDKYASSTIQNLAGAVGDAEKAIEIDPKFVKAYSRLGCVFSGHLPIEIC